VLDTISPTSVDAGSASFTLILSGSNFASDAIVHWGTSTRTTVRVSATVLHAPIESAELAAGGEVDVMVENPGGGMSSVQVFAITAPAVNPVPTLTSFEPDQAPTGGPGFLLIVHGTGFVVASQVLWNGSPLPTAYVNGTTLTATVSPGELTSVGPVPVTVSSPAPGGGVTTNVPFGVLESGLTSLDILTLPAYDLLYEPTNGVLFASIAGTGGARANSLTRIDPQAATVGTSVFMGSEPGRIARSDDGQYLYVALKGAAAVRRYNVAAGTAELQFALGSDNFFGPMYAEDVAVLPGLPHTVAVSTMWLGLSPRHAGVRIYDDGVVRPTATPQHLGSNEIEAASAGTLYGADTESSDARLRTMSITATGVTITDGVGSLASGAMTLAGGRLYTVGGRVIDPVAGQVVGTFEGAYGAFAVDLPNDRIFFIDRGIISVYRPSNFAYVGTIAVGAGVNTGHLVRWGTNGLAFIDGAMFGNPGTTVYVLTTTFLPAP
jgi:hypothetical protein